MPMDKFDPVLITALMPCYNPAPDMEKTIGCVLQQGRRHVELFVVCLPSRV
jgi:glycosyltransferase involved in cell wall biosynthesis